jgi:hypothetical protein
VVRPVQVNKLLGCPGETVNGMCLSGRCCRANRVLVTTLLGCPGEMVNRMSLGVGSIRDDLEAEMTSRPRPIATPIWAGSKSDGRDLFRRPFGGGEIVCVGQADRLQARQVGGA